MASPPGNSTTPILRPKKRTFWIVWNPRGHVPVRKHSTLAKASAEAARLAALKPPLHFYVLEVLGYARVAA